MARKAIARQTEVLIEKLTTGRATFWIKGESPLIFHAMSAKVKQELLMPKGRKTAAEKVQNLKHDVLDEFRNCVYRRLGNKGPTRLVFPSVAFKSAMANAAIEVPGAKKAQIGRLVWVEGEHVDVYGIPKLLMSIVRSADMNKTPDVRTRAILSEWCCSITVRFVTPTLSEISIARLLETSGLIMGIGDFRAGKGKGSYGQYRICDKADVASIIKSGGMKAQDAALKEAEAHDAETAEMLTWFLAERVRRGK